MQLWRPAAGCHSHMRQHASAERGVHENRERGMLAALPGWQCRQRSLPHWPGWTMSVTGHRPRSWPPAAAHWRPGRSTWQSSSARAGACAPATPLAARCSPAVAAPPAMRINYCESCADPATAAGSACVRCASIVASPTLLHGGKHEAACPMLRAYKQSERLLSST